MKKYRPFPLPKHWLAGTKEKTEFEFTTESSVVFLLGPLTLIALNPWLAIGLAILDAIAFVLIHFMIKNSFFSILLIIAAILVFIGNRYLCAWLRGFLIERRKKNA